MTGTTDDRSTKPLNVTRLDQIDNIMRDPFEQAWRDGTKSMTGYGGVLASPSSAYLYDWNILPLGQLMWKKEPRVLR